MALAAYRHVLRSARVAFKEDAVLLQAARLQTRTAFDSNQSLAPMSPEASNCIQHAEEVAKILRHNVVQGRPQEQEGIYKLNIHNGIERGDNETIKSTKEALKGSTGCCQEAPQI